MALATETNLDEGLAALYAADLLHRALLLAGEPIKASEAARIVGREEVDLRLARVILATHPDRFASTERRWSLWTRFGDAHRTMERSLDTALAKAGSPVTVEALAREMSAVYGRSAEYLEGVISRLLVSGSRYFPAGDNTYGTAAWLLDTSGATDEDVLFDNYLSPADVAVYEKKASKLDPAKLDTVIAFLDAVGQAVPNKALQFLAWRADRAGFDAAAFYTRLWRDGRAAFLSDGTWLGPKEVARLVAFFPGLAEREVDEHGDLAKAEAAEPLVIAETEAEQLINSVLGSETTSHAAMLLESTFEVSPGDPTWEGDLKTLMDTLAGDERVLWVGADRFLTREAVPGYVFSVPELLHFPVEHYTDAEGNDVDILLDDDGVEASLQREILSPLSQDVLDEEPAYTPDADPPSTARCVLKFHHKQIGTFPLCQLPAGFFPVEPAVIQAEVVLPAGQRAEIWVNNETRLLYGLLDWYETLPVDSGVVFYMDRQAPDRYSLTYGEETEPAMFISRNRVNELMELGQRAEDEQLPTFEILRQIMEHYRKGIEYLTLLTEVNVTRRSTRRTVASLLSGYHCLFQRGGAWVFDAKKLSQGFDKSKRKYLQK